MRYATEGIYLIDVSSGKGNFSPKECEFTYSIDGVNWFNPKRIGDLTDGGLPHFQVLSAQFKNKVVMAQGVAISELDVLPEIKNTITVNGGKLYIKFLIYIYHLNATSGEMVRLMIPSEIISVVEKNGDLLWEESRPDNQTGAERLLLVPSPEATPPR